MGRAFTKTAALVGAAVLAVSGCSASTAPGLAAFDRPTTSADAIPERVELPREYDQIRYIGEAGDAVVYAAQGSADEPWCVLAVLAGSDEGVGWVVGSSCADDARFAERGLRVGVSGAHGQQGEALLLPDDFDGEVQDGWEVITPNLAVRR